ncbi:MAG: hypothetical protein E6I93_09825 [Chloroflexi bacterium]|nr:MAG: hypothetical protein E6I93_09825 [Chloroflexota bacterium]
MKSKIMGAILLSLATFFSTLLGGLFGLRYRDHLNLILGFTPRPTLFLTQREYTTQRFSLESAIPVPTERWQAAAPLLERSSHAKEHLYAMGCGYCRIFRLRR